MNETTRRALLIVAFVAIGGALFWLTPEKIERGGTITPAVAKAEKSKKYPFAKELVNPSGFINTEPFNIADLIGKRVILVDFWTYSCINCQRTLPYLNAWDEKYRDQGLTIVGVHTPEFDFEKEYENVSAAAGEFGINYPIVQDNDYATWRAYANRYWPRKYLIDIDGYIVYDHIGEGGYDETEREIQKALKERMERLGESGDVAVGTVRPDAEAITDRMPRTPEIYFGAARNGSYLGNGRGGAVGEQQFALPVTPKTSVLYLGGNWDIHDEFARSGDGGASIVLRYQAKKVYFVARADSPTRVQVLRDGVPVTKVRGADVDADGYVTIQPDRLYRIIEEDMWSEHTLELRPETSGLEAYTFTFG